MQHRYDAAPGRVTFNTPRASRSRAVCGIWRLARGAQSAWPLLLAIAIRPPAPGWLAPPQAGRGSLRQRTSETVCTLAARHECTIANRRPASRSAVHVNQDSGIKLSPADGATLRESTPRGQPAPVSASSRMSGTRAAARYAAVPALPCRDGQPRMATSTGHRHPRAAPCLYVTTSLPRASRWLRVSSRSRLLPILAGANLARPRLPRRPCRVPRGVPGITASPTHSQPLPAARRLSSTPLARTRSLLAGRASKRLLSSLRHR